MNQQDQKTATPNPGNKQTAGVPPVTPEIQKDQKTTDNKNSQQRDARSTEATRKDAAK